MNSIVTSWIFVGLAVSGIIWNAATLHNDVRHIKKDIEEIKKAIQELKSKSES